MNNNDKHLTWLTHILESYQDAKETHIGNLKDPYLRSHSYTYKIKCENNIRLMLYSLPFSQLRIKR